MTACLLEVVLVVEGLLLDARRDELLVIDAAIAIEIDRREQRLQITQVALRLHDLVRGRGGGRGRGRGRGRARARARVRVGVRVGVGVGVRVRVRPDNCMPLV